MESPGDDLTACTRAFQRDEPGSNEAIARLIRPAVLRYLLGRGLSPHDADDLTQDCCMAALKALAGWRDEGRPAWALVFSIVRNKLVDRTRQHAVNREALFGDMTVHDLPRQESPAELMELDESTAGVAALLDELPATQRDVLLLRIIVGLSSAETATALGLTAGSVRVIQFRGMTALRRQLSSRPLPSRAEAAS